MYFAFDLRLFHCDSLHVTASNINIVCLTDTISPGMFQPWSNLCKTTWNLIKVKLRKLKYFISSNTMTIIIKSTNVNAPNKLQKRNSILFTLLFNGRPNKLFIKFIFMHSKQQWLQ